MSKPLMLEPRTLAADGCDRATAYHMSNKVVRRGDGLYVTWLDARYRNVIARVDPGSGGVEGTFIVAQGFDNHCGAAMVMTPDGRVHVVCGSHHTGFLYRAARDPIDASSWGVPEATGFSATYPSLVSDPHGNLHLAHRFGARHPHDRWGVGWFTKEKEAPWGYGRLLARAPVPLYTYPTATMAVGPGGAIHLVIEWYKTWADSALRPRSMAISHLESENGRDWQHTDGREVKAFPVQLEDTSPIVFRGGGNLRPGNVTVLPDGRPCLAFWDQDARTLEVAVRDRAGEWRIADLGALVDSSCPGTRFSGQGQIGATSDGNLIVVFTRSADGEWAGLTNEMHVARLDPDALRILAQGTVAKTNPSEPDWLPSLEKPPAGVFPDDLWLLYQAGRRGEGCINEAKCEVKLVSTAELARA